MRKKIILIVLLIVLFLGIVVIIFIKPLKYKLKITYYENELNKYFNLEKTECVSEYSNADIDYYLSQPIYEYDITKFINYYFEQIINKKEEKIDNFADFTNIHMHAMDLSDFVDEENVNLNEVAKELEKIFIHKSDDIYEEWYLPADSKEEVDMPFGYYYSYEKTDYKKLNNIKKVSDFKFIEDINFEKSKRYKYSMKLYMDDNTIVEIAKEIEYSNNHNVFEPILNHIYYEEHEGAHITLKNRDIDKAVEEYWSRPNAF